MGARHLNRQFGPPAWMAPIAHRRPVLLDPPVPDPGREARMRARCGALVAMMIREAKRDMTHAARTKALASIRGTAGGAEQREMASVPADRAGEAYLSAADGNIAHLRQAGVLTARQCDAAAHMARLYGIGGGRTPWARGHGQGRPDDVVERARAEFADLLAASAQRSRADIVVLCMGEWVTSHDPLPLWREGLAAIADRLRLAA